MIAATMIASIRAQTICRSRRFEAHAERFGFLHAGVISGADPHIGRGVKTGELLTSA
jgi:hypothetical protein